MGCEVCWRFIRDHCICFLVCADCLVFVVFGFLCCSFFSLIDSVFSCFMLVKPVLFSFR